MEELLTTEQARARIKWGVGVPRTPELFHVPNSPCLGVKWPGSKAGVGSALSEQRNLWPGETLSAFALLPLVLKEQRRWFCDQNDLVCANERGLSTGSLVFLINASESTVATLDEKHGRDVNPSGITFEMEFIESLSEEMFELKL